MNNQAYKNFFKRLKKKDVKSGFPKFKKKSNDQSYRIINVNENIKIDFKTTTHDKKITGNKIAFPVIEKEGKAKLINLNLDLFCGR